MYYYVYIYTRENSISITYKGPKLAVSSLSHAFISCVTVYVYVLFSVQIHVYCLLNVMCQCRVMLALF